jgi:CheY-like chemotaxis protein
MPQMDGFEFAAAVRRHPEWRTIPIVVVTAQDLTNEERKRLNGHVDSILRKSADSRQSILAQVRDLLAGSHAARKPHELPEMATT